MTTNYRIIHTKEELQKSLEEIEETIRYVEERSRRTRSHYLKDSYEEELIHWRELRDELKEEIKEK